jgi:hypothetical protein
VKAAYDTPAAIRLLFFKTALAVLALGTTAGCGYLHTGDTAPGDAVRIERTFYFAFRRQDGNTADTTAEQAKRFVLEDTSWQAPRGVNIESRRISITNSDIASGWPSLPDHVAGIEMQVSCVARIDQDTTPGDLEIKLGLPGLARLGHAVDAKPTLEKVSDGEIVFLLSPEEVTSNPDTYQIRRLTVHGSPAQRNVHGVMKQTVIILSVVAFVVGWWAVAGRFFRQNKKQDEVKADGTAR